MEATRPVDANSGKTAILKMKAAGASIRIYAAGGWWAGSSIKTKYIDPCETVYEKKYMIQNEN